MHKFYGVCRYVPAIDQHMNKIEISVAFENLINCTLCTCVFSGYKLNWTLILEEINKLGHNFQ